MTLGKSLWAEAKDIHLDSKRFVRANRIRVGVLLALFSVAVVASLMSHSEAPVVDGGDGRIVTAPVHVHSWAETCEHLAIELLGAILIFMLIDAGFKRMEVLTTTGIREHDKLPIADVLSQIASATKEVRVMDIFLRQFLTQQPERRLQFVEALRAAYQRGALIRILVSKPGTPILAERADDMRDRSATVLADVQACFEDLRYIRWELTRNGNAKHFRFRQFDSMPQVALYGVDGTVYMGFYPPSSFSSESAHIQFDENSVLGRIVCGTFETVWTDKDTSDVAPFAPASASS